MTGRTWQLLLIQQREKTKPLASSALCARPLPFLTYKSSQGWEVVNDSLQQARIPECFKGDDKTITGGEKTSLNPTLLNSYMSVSNILFLARYWSMWWFLNSKDSWRKWIISLNFSLAAGLAMGQRQFQLTGRMTYTGNWKGEMCPCWFYWTSKWINHGILLWHLSGVGLWGTVS